MPITSFIGTKMVIDYLSVSPSIWSLTDLHQMAWLAKQSALLKAIPCFDAKDTPTKRACTTSGNVR